MLTRHLFTPVMESLEVFPAVALLGCRQTGKTTLANQIQKAFSKPSLYLDLELPEDRHQFSDPQLMLTSHTNQLLILDEIQRVPELFSVMRGIIDRRRQQGEHTGHYLILGSASPQLLKQSSESLAGRIAYHTLCPFTLKEILPTYSEDRLSRLWLRGGFPNSFLAQDDKKSFLWRKHFIRTYLERDVTQILPSFPADRIYRLWMMLAYDQGVVLNINRLATSLEMSASSVRVYLEKMVDLFLIRFLRPWSGNNRKRLIKSPKVYVRDSGIVHALANLDSLEAVMGHSLCGFSWEGFIIEQIIQALPDGIDYSFYRTSSGHEIDLVLEHPTHSPIAIEIKRTTTPTLSKGFYEACDDLQAGSRYVVVPEGRAYMLGDNTQVIGIDSFLTLLPTLLPS